MDYVESRSTKHHFLFRGVLKSAALLSSSRVISKAAVFTFVAKADGFRTWSNFVHQDSRVSWEDNQITKQILVRISVLIIGWRKADFPLVLMTTKLPSLILATNSWWSMELFLVMQNVPLFPIIAQQSKLKMSRSYKSLITEKVFIGPTCFGMSNRTERGTVQLFQVIGKLPPLIDRSLPSTSMSRPETTVNATLLSFCIYPMYQYGNNLLLCLPSQPY